MQHKRQWLYLRPALDLINLLDRVGVKSAARKAVNRFRRNGNELPCGYERSRCVQIIFSDYLSFHQLSACLLSFSA